MRRPAVCALLSAAMFLACGGGRSPTSSTAPRPSPSPRGMAAGSVVTVVRGDNGAAVAGATVTVAGRPYVADDAGNVRVEDAAAPGALVDVTAPSVLDRQTVVRGGPLGTLVLWPRSTARGTDEAFTVSVVYTRSSLLGVGPPGAEPLRRFTPGVSQVVVVPTAEILDDERAHSAHGAGVSRLNAAAQGAVTYALARETPSSGPVFAARVSADDASCGERVLGFARLSLRAGEIVGGEIVYCSSEAARDPRLVVHELGHTFGLQHSSDPRDMMFGTLNRAHAEDFLPREVEVMSLMMQRRAGNRFPDSDRDVPGLSAAETVIVCH